MSIVQQDPKIMLYKINWKIVFLTGSMALPCIYILFSL